MTSHRWRRPAGGLACSVGPFGRLTLCYPQRQGLQPAPRTGSPLPRLRLRPCSAMRQLAEDRLWGLLGEAAPAAEPPPGRKAPPIEGVPKDLHREARFMSCRCRKLEAAAPSAKQLAADYEEASGGGGEGAPCRAGCHKPAPEPCTPLAPPPPWRTPAFPPPART